MVEERRAAPREDAVSVLAASTIDGEFLSEGEIVLNCYSLILGGDATARRTMIDSVHSFSTNPEQWAAFKRGDVSVKSAAEEVLRWASPTMHFGRTRGTGHGDPRDPDQAGRCGDGVEHLGKS